MLSPERSDIDISKLFNWGKPVNIYDVNNSILLSCYIRLVGDAELNRARVFALRKSAEQRKKMKLPESDERMAYIADKEAINKEELINYIVLLQSKRYNEKAYKEVQIKYPKEPETDAPLEEQEKFQTEVDSFSDRVAAAVRKYVEDKINAETERLSKLAFDELYTTYESLVINDMCEYEMINAFRDMCVFFGTFEDETCKKRLFDKVEDFQSLPTDLKKQFEEEYNSLEIDIETLKKLHEAMP